MNAIILVEVQTGTSSIWGHRPESDRALSISAGWGFMMTSTTEVTRTGTSSWTSSNRGDVCRPCEVLDDDVENESAVTNGLWLDIDCL